MVQISSSKSYTASLLKYCIQDNIQTTNLNKCLNINFSGFIFKDSNFQTIIPCSILSPYELSLFQLCDLKIIIVLDINKTAYFP